MLKLVKKRYIISCNVYFLNSTDILENAALIYEILVKLVVWSMISCCGYIYIYCKILNNVKREANGTAKRINTH